MILNGRQGTGAGTTVKLKYDPAHWGLGGGLRADEVLVHELLHAMRIIHGKVINWTIPENTCMDDFEEFCAIVCGNIYRSERGLPNLRKDHCSESRLDQKLSDSVAYYRFYMDEIDRWYDSQHGFCLELAGAPAKFNPLRAKAIVDGLMPTPIAVH